MTADEFRRLALSMPQATEGAHMGHPDFRVGGKIFASLWPDNESGMVKLKPDQQKQMVKAHPDMLAPVKGGWGKGGATQVRLKSASAKALSGVMMTAWQNTAPAKLGGTRVGKATPARSRETAHVALLRGINVGGKNKVPMAALSQMFAEAGCGNVKTYIQSGNVVFTATPTLAGRIAEVISKCIADRLGHRVPVVLRSAEELRTVAESNPFLKPGATTESLAVVFLADEPDAGRAEKLDPQRSPGDVFKVVGRDIYLRLAHGFADTKLTNAWFDATLATVSTARNWRTVLTLVEMLEAIQRDA